MPKDEKAKKQKKQNNTDSTMVAIKTSLALPSLTKSASSRSTSPASTPAVSEQGAKRNVSVSVLEALPRTKSRSGEGSKRSQSSNGHRHHHSSHHPEKGAAPAPLTSTVSPVPAASSNSGPASHASSALRPKLSALLSGRSTPSQAPSTPALLPPNPQHAGGTPVGTPSAAGIPGGAAVPTALPGQVAISNLEASYVTKIGMSLNDAVNKVFPAHGSLVAGASHHHAADNLVYKGHCAPKVDKAREVGQMIANELHLAVNDQYLLRSLLRSAVLKCLSIFLSRLEGLMVNPSSDPAILSVAKTVREAENPPLAQRYCFLVVRSAWELKKGLVKACGCPSAAAAATATATASPGGTGSQLGPPSTEAMPKFVKDTLAPWITKLDLLANRIFNPMLAAIKQEAINIVVLPNSPDDVGSSGPGGAAALGGNALHLQHKDGLVVGGPVLQSSATGNRSISLTRSPTPVMAGSSNGSSVSTGANGPLCPVPAYLKDLSNLLAATSRIFAWVAVNDSDLQKWKVSIGSSLIWKILLTTSAQRGDGEGCPPRRRSSPPPVGLTTLSGQGVSGVASPHGGAAAPLAAVPHQPQPKRSMSAMGMGRLRGTSSHANGKRSPSPPYNGTKGGADGSAVASPVCARLVAEMEMFEAVLEKFVSSLLHPLAEPASHDAEPCKKGKSCPICRGRFVPLDLDDSDDEEALPREAMQEAMAALSSFIVLLRAFTTELNIVPLLLKAIPAVDDTSLAPEICPNLIRALDTLPPLILLHTVVSRIPRWYSFRMPHQLWNTTWQDYESTMKGFHTGEEWVGEVGWELLKERQKVLSRLLAEERQDGDQAVQLATIPPSTPPKVDEDGWLELLRLAIVGLAHVEDLEDAGDVSASGLSVRSDAVAPPLVAQH